MLIHKQKCEFGSSSTRKHTFHDMAGIIHVGVSKMTSRSRRIDSGNREEAVFEEERRRSERLARLVRRVGLFKALGFLKFPKRLRSWTVDARSIHG